MAEFLVLVNGLPGSGKSTLAGQLAATLRVPLISKDAIKETLTDLSSAEAGAAAGVAASEAMWDVAAATPGLVVLESWWFRPRDLGYVRNGLRRCGDPPAVEIWCSVPAAVALARVKRRKRAAVHRDEEHVAAHWTTWVAGAEPLGVAYEMVVGTDGPVDVAGLAGRVRQARLSR